MKEEAIAAVVEGLIEAPVDLVSYLPDSEFGVALEALRSRSGIKCVPVSNESTGVSLCAGAWFGGKTPALLIATSGLIVASWPLLSVSDYYDIPLVLVIPYRGDMGDPPLRFRSYHYTTRLTLDMLQIPYRIAREISEVKPAIKDARKTAMGWLHPAAVLISGDALFEEGH